MAKQWLFIEVSLPWAKNPWADQPTELIAIFEQIEQMPRLWQQLRIVAIAPDQSDSQRGHRHVFFYQKPDRPTAAYLTQAYQVPVQQLAALVKALTLQPNDLPQFQPYWQPPTRSLFVCTHTRYDLACGRFGTPLYRTLRQHYAQSGTLTVWQTAHFGGHNFAPTLIDFPMGQFWGHLEPGILDVLVHRQGDVARLRPFYRGRSGLSRWEQIAEREVWIQQGWHWLSFPLAARTLRRDPGQLHHRLLRWILRWIPSIQAQVLLKKLEQKLTWADVEMTWQDNQTTQRYCARVEANHTVTTQLRSGKDARLSSVPQYRVRPL